MTVGFNLNNLNNLNNLKNHFVRHRINYLKLIMIIVSILVVIIILGYVFKHKSHKRHNPIFFKKPLSGRKKYVLSESKVFPMGKKGERYNLTYHLFLYIKDWNYLYGITKEIFQKGDSDSMAPGLYLDPVVNNIIVKVKTQNSGIQTFKVENIDINRWFHFAIVIHDLQVTLYHNGKVISNNLIPSLLHINNDPLTFNENGGFSGLIYNLGVVNKALGNKEIYALSKKKPPTNSKYFKI